MKAGPWVCLTFTPLAIAFSFWACAADGDNPGAIPRESVLCGAAEGKSCGDKVCDPLRGCVDCQTDADCKSGDREERFCISGACQGCRTNTDCAEPTPSCWPSDHQCRSSCAQGAACPISIPLCQSVVGACVRCVDSTQCAAPTTICDDVTRQCVECSKDDQCPAATPRCVLRDGRCAECVYNSDCPESKPICDAERLTCRAGCTTNTQCSNPTPQCTPAGRCAECVNDVDCPLSRNRRKQVCKQEGECVECKSATDCPKDAPNCDDGVCQK